MEAQIKQGECQVSIKINRNLIQVSFYDTHVSVFTLDYENDNHTSIDLTFEQFEMFNRLKKPSEV